MKSSNKLAPAFISALLFVCGCSSWWTVPGPRPNPNVYHIGRHGWIGDSIFFQVYRTSDSSAKPGLSQADVECKSCNLIYPPFKAEFNESGIARIYIPEARQLISVRLHIRGSGIDTTFIQTQRSPEQAMSYFNLSRPLTGRVMIDHFAVLYADSSLDSSVAIAQVGDELNTFASRSSSFYLVQHPDFTEPLYLLKEDAVRLY